MSSHRNIFVSSPGRKAGSGRKADVGRKAAASYISWVLLTALAVALSALMYKFMVDYSESTTEDVKNVVYDTDECREAGLSIESVCASSQVLNITLQNRNYARLDGLDFRLYSGNMPIHTNATNITLNPNRNKLISLNTGTAQTVTYVEVIPRIEKDNEAIICGERKAAAAVTVC